MKTIRDLLIDAGASRIEGATAQTVMTDHKQAFIALLVGKSLGRGPAVFLESRKLIEEIGDD